MVFVQCMLEWSHVGGVLVSELLCSYCVQVSTTILGEILLQKKPVIVNWVSRQRVAWRLQGHGFWDESGWTPMASEITVQLWPHTEWSVCDDVVHPAAGVLPGCRQYCWKAGWISSYVGSGCWCCLHATDWLWVGSYQRVLWFAKEKELAFSRFVWSPFPCCIKWRR